MTSPLNLFFQSGIADQLAVAGTPCTIKNPNGSVVPFTGILSESSAQLETMPGMMEHTVTGHLLIPLSASITPEPSAVVAANGKKYMVTDVVKSPCSAAWSCGLQATTK